MKDEMSQNETPIIFLAMFWGGGGPYTIPEIVFTYDWINRAIPSRNEMLTALNSLLAMGLIEEKDDKFQVTKQQFSAFDKYRKKKRKDRFEMARMYLDQLPKPASVPKKITFTEPEYSAYVKAYKKLFDEAAKSS